MNTPAFITYKEIMLMYGMNERGAKNKLTVIRSILGKKRFQNILVAEFCQAESVDRTLFEKELQMKISMLYKPKQSQQIAFSFT